MLTLPVASDKAPILSGIRGQIPGEIRRTVDLAIGSLSTQLLDSAFLHDGKEYLVVYFTHSRQLVPHFCRLGDPSKLNYCQNTLTRSISRTPDLNIPFRAHPTKNARLPAVNRGTDFHAPVSL